MSTRRAETEDIVATHWMSEKKVAQLTGLSVHTLRGHRLRRTGIPYIKVGRSVRYSFEDITSYMQERKILF